MPAVIVDGNARTERLLEPGELGLVEDQIVAIGLRVVIRVASQRLPDDVEPILRDQGPDKPFCSIAANNANDNDSC